MKIDDCLNRPIIATLEPHLLGYSKRCFINPLWIKNRPSDHYSQIDPSDFPGDRGGIELNLDPQGPEPKNFVEQNGTLIIIHINHLSDNGNQQRSRFFAKFYPPPNQDRSDIRIEKFPRNGFLQVVNHPEDIEKLKREPLIPFHRIFTDTILIKSEMHYYGPFEYEKKDDGLFLRALKSNHYYIAKYPNMPLEYPLYNIKTGNENINFVETSRFPSFDHISHDDRIDWLDEGSLIDEFISSLKKHQTLNADAVRSLKSHLEDNKELSWGGRRSRIENGLKDILDQENALRGFVYFALDNQSCREQIFDRILKERSEELMKEFTDRDNNREKIEERKNELYREISDLENKKREIEDNLDQFKAESLSVNQDKINEKHAEFNEIESKFNELKNKHDLATEIEQLRKARDESKTQYDTWKTEVDKLQEKRDQIALEFADQARTSSKLIDKSFLERILNEIENKEGDKPSFNPFEKNLLWQVQELKDLIGRIQGTLKRVNRVVSHNDLVNYLICITQSFITTFVGEPGSGKTSLCYLLAKSLGLARRDDNNRFVELSVERGWTSHKDFIGYYNPLSKTMVQSNHDIFSALELLNAESGNKQENLAPFFILLDEANLSPIEHYWASFLRNCDFDSTHSRSINLGGVKILKIPDHLRFLATVNFDHTTEELSPRFLDRSWIIPLSQKSFRGEIDFPADSIQDDKDVISYDSLERLFNKKKEDRIIDEKWDAIQAGFEEANIPILPRNLIKVRNYISTACCYMELNAADTRFAPLDYALVQKILPTINGTGTKYEALVDYLIEKCKSGLPMSLKHLQRIKEAAENNMGFYQFFTR